MINMYAVNGRHLQERSGIALNLGFRFVTLSWLFLPTSGNAACLNKIIMKYFLPLFNRKDNKVNIIDCCLGILLVCCW